MIRYVAFLRGINVGGHKKVPMAQLKTMLEEMGFENVKTVLASGNAVFDAEESKADVVQKKIAKAFGDEFGFDAHIIIRTVKELQQLAKLNPFKGIKVTPNTRLYITFLTAKPKTKLKIPHVSPTKDFKILSIVGKEICSVLTLSPAMGTVDSMNILEKEFGKDITTRNWNTVEKLLV